MQIYSIKNQAGASILEVLITMAIVIIISVGIISLVQVSNKNIATLEEKLAILDLKKTLISVSIGKNICQKKFSETPANYTYTLATFPPASIEIPSLYMNTTDATALVEKNSSLPGKVGVLIDSIVIKNITGSGPAFIADLFVSFKGTTISRRPITTKINLNSTVVNTDIILTGCTVANISAAPADPQEACLLVGGTWVQPGSGRPDFCKTSTDSIQWY